jgi:hypothetical protein
MTKTINTSNNKNRVTSLFNSLSSTIFIVIAVFVLSLAYNIKINYMKEPTFIEELKLYWGKECYHIHHWITFSLIIGLILIVQYTPPIISYIIIAFSLGAIVEDFLFSDIFVVKEMCIN